MRCLLFALLGIVVGCGAVKESKTTPDLPPQVQIEVISAPHPRAAFEIERWDSILNPDFVGAEHYVLRFKWRKTGKQDIDFSLWHLEDGKYQSHSRIFHRWGDMSAYESRPYELDWGHRHEYEVRVWDEGSADLLFALQLDKARLRLPLLRTIRLDLTEKKK